MASETRTVRRSLFDLTAKVAVVTGAASGLGRAIALGLADQGASVALGDINVEGAAATAGEIAAAGGSAQSMRCDVTDRSQLETLFDGAVGEFGRVDILVNDAFVPAVRAHTQDVLVEDWDRVLRVNLTGYLLGCQVAAQRMISGGRGGSIVNIGSIAGASGTGRGLVAYAVGKAGIHQLTKELAVEWAKHGIRVNAILPCQIMTPALANWLADPTSDAATLMSTFLGGIPLGRLGTPEDVMGTAVFLASDAAAMVTGALIPVDGGNLAMNAGASLDW